MRSVPLPSGSPRVRLSRTLPRVGTLLVLLGLVTLLVVTPARATWGGTPSVKYAWNNSSVLCVFNSSLPAVTVSAWGMNGTGMGAGLDQMTELSPGGTPVATAVMSSVAWDPNNTSSSSWFVMDYTQTVPVMNAAAPAQSLGSVLIDMSFSLVRNPVNVAQSDQVAVQLVIGHWPGQSAQDTLALEVPLWSAFAASEHIVVGSPTSSRVDSVSTANDQSLEYFEASVTAQTATGASVPVAAHTVVTAGKAATTLTFGTGAGQAAALTYEATLGITPSTRVLGLPLYDYAAATGAAGLVALAVGVGTRRIRRRPSDLTFVEEPE